jgi:hypothetical protein
MSISTLISDIGANGLQSGARYLVGIGNFTVPDTYIISVDLPGPKYDILNINYWEGNQYARIPVGLRIEDPLIINMLIPGNDTFLNSFSEYTSTLFTQPNSGPYFGNSTGNYFSYTRGAKGIGIIVTTQNMKDETVHTFSYKNCFLEKALPLKFAADSPQPVYVTLSFAVGFMG